MKICSYTLTADTGFAPNPFHSYCTLAACTPNHMNARLNKDDYIAGYFTDTGEPHLVYHMKVDEVLDYDSYFKDPRFRKKKPNLNGSWVERCGDNIYHIGSSGNWVREKNLYHRGERSFAQDTRYAVVYIGRQFSYFGQEAYSPQNQLSPNLLIVLKKGQGIKYTRESDSHFSRYLAWLLSKTSGRNGDPRDRERSECSPGGC